MVWLKLGLIQKKKEKKKKREEESHRPRTNVANLIKRAKYIRIVPMSNWNPVWLCHQKTNELSIGSTENKITKTNKRMENSSSSSITNNHHHHHHYTVNTTIQSKWMIKDKMKKKERSGRIIIIIMESEIAARREREKDKTRWNDTTSTTKKQYNEMIKYNDNDNNFEWLCCALVFWVLCAEAVIWGDAIYRFASVQNTLLFSFFALFCFDDVTYNNYCYG